MSEKATEVAEMLERFKQQDWNRHTGGSYETIEEMTQNIVENGSMTPEARITSELSLTVQERLTGKREQDMTAMFSIGLLIGTALERDVPKDSLKEDRWRDGKFTLPDIDA